MEERQISSREGKRPTIGLLIDWLGGRYQALVWPGVVDAAKKRDANLVVFSGRVLNSPYGYTRQSNALYDLISPKNLDGLLILSGTLCEYASPEEFSAFCHNFSPLPTVSLSIEIPNLPNVLVDNESGMRAVMSHLIEAHGFRRIAFIGGPESNDEAQQRLRVYREELARHDIAFNPMLVAPGEFNDESGMLGVRLFLDERGVIPEAIVAVDDETALGVISELKVHGLSVPGDVALTGFDDIAEAKFYSPALTTVRQPFYDQSYAATMMLLDQLEGKPIPRRVLLPTQLITRQSCGCLPHSINLAGKGAVRNIYPSLNERWRDTVISMVSEAMEQIFPGQTSSEDHAEWVTTISDGFIADMDQSGGDLFLRTLDHILREENDSRTEMSSWQDFISSMRKDLLVHIPEIDKRLQAENLFSQARVVVSEAVERVHALRALQMQNHTLIESDVDESVLTTLDVEELKFIISDTLPIMGVNSGYIVTSSAEKYNPASLFMAFDETGILKDVDTTAFEPQVCLLPEGLFPKNRRCTFVVEALYFQTDQLGYALFEMGSRSGILYTTLRRQISSALRGALLLQEYREAQERIQEVNKELEVFSYSVSHDLKAPLRAISQLATWIVEDYAEALDQEGKDKLNLLVDRTKHMHHLIDGILAYSRIGRISEKVSKTDLNSVVKDLISVLDPPDTIQITIQNKLPMITGEPTYIIQVFQNLLSNAILYMDKPNGYIKIKCEEMENTWLISVADNGPGIADKYHEKIFQMFQTLGTRKDVDSTGIGLALVKRIVEKWGGKIWVESTPGLGSCFFFTIPKNGRDV